jgi:hypothetical protein
MLERILKHKYLFHILAALVIVTTTAIFIVFSGTSN